MNDVVERLRPIPATIGGGGGEVRQDYRDSAVAFFPEGHWIMGMMFHFGAIANSQNWRLDLSGPSPVQFTVYRENQFYDWHLDVGGEPPQARSVRKISVVMQLSDPTEYEGGELEFKLDAETERARVITAEEARPAGSIVVFPSYIPHRVRPVTKGVRRSLVCWLVGPPFR